MKWQYGMALYQHKLNECHPRIDCRNNELAMEDVDEVQTQLGLLRFLKEAGSKGWELCSPIAPWPERYSLTARNEDGTDGEDFTVADRFDIQWLIFKRPTN
jgi:hypothetical protein